MTDDEIVALWRQHKEVMGFAKALLTAEREACAKVCEEPGWNAANWCAKQIRARGQDPMPLFDDWDCPTKRGA